VHIGGCIERGGSCVQVWSLLPQNQIGCKKGIVRKSKQDKKGDMWAISNKEKNTKSWNNYKNKGTEHIHFLLLGDGAITNNFTECEGG
jgi:hypothetical protein